MLISLQSRSSARTLRLVASDGPDNLARTLCTCSMSDSYSVAVRGRCMIAHSFKGERFGPARALHGCTYVIDAICKGPCLLPENYLVDICAAEAALESALSNYHLRNLDELVEFSEDNTTCERLALAVWERVAKDLATSQPAVDALQVVVRESDVAHVEYERRLGADAAPGLYTVSVRGRFMAARSLRAERFGDAQQLHGGTFVVDALFSGPSLVPDATFLIDICLAEELVQRAVTPLHQTSLDGHPALSGHRNPTAGAIAEVLWASIAAGLQGTSGIEQLKLVVKEHDLASAEYVRRLPRAGENSGTHTLVARGRCMIAHSFKGEAFGPAQALHGCTYVIDGRFDAAALSPDDAGFVCERGEAERALREAIAHYHQTNLDDLAEFASENTTCERVARAVWARTVSALSPVQRGGLTALEILVRESDVAWVAFRRSLGPTHTAGGTAIILDVDSLADAAALENTGNKPGTTPTGIVHRTALGDLLAVVPYRTLAVSSRPPHESERALARLGLGIKSHAMSLATPDVASKIVAPRTALVTASDALCRVMTAGSNGLVASPLVGPGCAADRALLCALGCCSPRVDDGPSRVAYLTAKRPIDAAAYSAEVRHALASALSAARNTTTGTGTLRVFDLGAGTLSMLPVVAAAAAQGGWSSLDYCAFDADQSLVDAAARQLRTSCACTPLPEGAPRADAGDGAPQVADVLVAQICDVSCRVSLYVADVLELESIVGTSFAPCDLVVGSGFADLLPPVQMANLLARLSPAGLAYLPITFAGVTRLDPMVDGGGTIPSDAYVMDAYHAHLRAQGQFLEPGALVRAVEDAAGRSISCGASHWVVPPDTAMHTWMIDFLGSGTARALWAAGFDPAAWRAAVVHRRATVVAENVDLLLQLPPRPAATEAQATGTAQSNLLTYSALEFVAPRSVAVVHKAPSVVSASGVVIRSVVSMISSGTEMLIYRGQFDDSDEPLDKTIKGLSSSRLSYPMAYGYSLVGRVERVGSDVPTRLLGTLVFAFAPHAECAYTDATGLQPVPEGIAPADAAFLPAAETAISIVHDAHPRLGERVHVFGAGVIGLLVVSCLARLGVHVVSIEPDESRRRLALQLGATESMPPTDAPRKRADVSIECSGAPAALQGAIDSTVDCGRVVVASWYGQKAVNLTLGTSFHRSHIEIVASQVSEITGPHARRWSKARRFEAAWELLRIVQPTAHLPVVRYGLAQAAEAYEMIDQGKTASIALFSYSGSGEVQSRL